MVVAARRRAAGSIVCDASGDGKRLQRRSAGRVDEGDGDKVIPGFMRCGGHWFTLVARGGLSNPPHFRRGGAKHPVGARL